MAKKTATKEPAAVSRAKSSVVVESRKQKRKASVSYTATQKQKPDELREDTTPYIVDTPRKQRASTVAANRKYAVEFVSTAKSISTGWLKTFNLENAVSFGLPEVDDRYHIWRVPLVKAGTKDRSQDARAQTADAVKRNSENATASRNGGCFLFFFRF